MKEFTVGHFDLLKSCDRNELCNSCYQSGDFAAKFQPDRLSGLAGEVEIGDGRTVHDDNILSEM